MEEYQFQLIFLFTKSNTQLYISISITFKFKSLLYLLVEHLIKRQNSRLESRAGQANHNVKTLGIIQRQQNPTKTQRQ